jgi:hypothetical protein
MDVPASQSARMGGTSMALGQGVGVVIAQFVDARKVKE